jgi:hypothetical protein
MTMKMKAKEVCKKSSKMQLRHLSATEKKAVKLMAHTVTRFLISFTIKVTLTYMQLGQAEV